MAKQASCTLADLTAGGAIPLTATINGQSVVVGTLVPRSFASGSYGYGLSGKATLPIPGATDKHAYMQMSINLTVVGSKPAKEESKGLIAVDDDAKATEEAAA